LGQREPIADEALAYLPQHGFEQVPDDGPESELLNGAVQKNGGSGSVGLDDALE
jgi:hypothetical protein